MGPKLFHVPVLLGLAYIGMAYVSWRMGCLIVGSISRETAVATPLVASFVMVAWDLAQDPVWATALHAWIWRDGGPWFGVPVSNYLGWYGTVFTIYLLFSLYLKRMLAPTGSSGLSSGRAATLFYAVCALGNVAQMLARGQDAIVRDPSGQQWRVGDIVAASMMVSIFGMGAFALIAWTRASQQTAAVAQLPYPETTALKRLSIEEKAPFATPQRVHELWNRSSKAADKTIRADTRR